MMMKIMRDGRILLLVYFMNFSYGYSDFYCWLGQYCWIGHKVFLMNFFPFFFNVNVNFIG